MGHIKGSDWWFMSGVMYACDHKVLIGYNSNAVLKWYMIYSQLSEVWSWCWDHGPVPAVLREAILPHSTRDCLLHAHHSLWECIFTNN